MRFKGDWASTLASASRGEMTTDMFCWHPGASLCVVLAAAGYPESPRTGDVIDGLESLKDADGLEIFHAGTRLAEGGWRTAGGRVLGVTARGSTLTEASRRAYAAVEKIRFAGMQYRLDIGARGLKRLA